MESVVSYMGDSFPEDWIATLDRLKALDFDTVMPGHGVVFTGKGEDRGVPEIPARRVTQTAALRKQGLSADDAAAESRRHRLPRRASRSSAAWASTRPASAASTSSRITRSRPTGNSGFGIRDSGFADSGSRGSGFADRDSQVGIRGSGFVPQGYPLDCVTGRYVRSPSGRQAVAARTSSTSNQVQSNHDPMCRCTRSRLR